MTVAFYNVSNLFDMEDEPENYDDEFTPEGKNKWNRKRYIKKLTDVSRVVSSINEGDLPEIVGFCEVENEKVLKDITSTGLLASGRYRVVHHESPDGRGIDCALIYRPAEFRVTYHLPVPVRFSDDPGHKTRDILYVKGRTTNREEFHIFVNHWPSRIGGQTKTESKRLAAARILKERIDSVIAVSPKANIIVMGDMNDNPDNKSLLEIVGARSLSAGDAGMVNLMLPAYKEGRGSFFYNGEWQMYDNIIVSESLLDDRGFRCMEGQGHIFHDEWMKYTNRQGVKIPNRTFDGNNYYGGVSDHFPVYFRMRR